jgi:hypothetical protein
VQSVLSLHRLRGVGIHGVQALLLFAQRLGERCNHRGQLGLVAGDLLQLGSAQRTGLAHAPLGLVAPPHLHSIDDL